MRTPPKGRLFLIKTRSRPDKMAAGAKLENTLLSTGVFMTVFIQEQTALRRLVIVCREKLLLGTDESD